MNSVSRLPPSAAALVDRSRPLAFEYRGRRIEAFEGDTVASALLASGVDIFSRSFKYHRPRGLLCCEGRCPNCLMDVDGSPNVRACTEPARPGMKVSPQNAWPSPEFDLLAFLRYFGFLMPVGFYYKIFHKPRFLWPLFEHFIRKVAGLGRVDTARVPPYTYDRQHLQTDVLVVGGGPAGLSAALAAAESGASVALVDENPFLGGHFRFQHPDSKAFRQSAELAQQVRSRPEIRVRLGAAAFGLYEGDLVGAVQGRRLLRIRTRRLVVAGGLIERPLVFGDNDLPGIMLGRAVQRLIHLHGVCPGRRAVVVGSNDRALTVAEDLMRAGVAVAAYADHRERLDESSAAVRALSAGGARLLTAATVAAAEGSRHVEAVTLAPLSGAGETHRVACDLLVLSTGGDPAIHLALQGGARGVFDAARREFLAGRLREGHFTAGDANGVHDAGAILLDGRRAGLAAAQGLGARDRSSEIAGLERALAGATALALNPPGLVAPPSAGKRFVCVCEDVVEKDIGDAVREGFDGIETLKRYSTVSMGPCQGKMCQAASIGLCARETGRSVDETGATTARPPVHPVALGVLAGRNHHPYKVVPTHSRQAALRAKIMNLGDWLRPEAYTTPAEECRAVHERVGLIDLSTLGRIDLRGPDVVKLLDRVYINAWGNLKPGRTRYGVMCDDAGIIFDDGTCARLGEQHYFMTTTTSGVETVYQWLLWWLAESPWDVCVTNVTAAYAAVNLAGPRARDVLRKLTSLSLDTAAFPYMGCAQARVADVPCILFRIGFVGELGYEIHYPAEYGEFLWDALMEAGREFGIGPFGVEAQRVLRLQKRHIIVTQDTDALSQPLEADLAWAVKFDKGDFIGRRALVEAKAQGARNALVGFTMADGGTPAEGDQVIEGGRSVGRVTSSRFSHYLNRSIGLAWVPVSRAKEGETIRIRVRGALADARVATKPFYDPDGGRMKA